MQKQRYVEVLSHHGILDASQFAVPFSSRYFSLLFTILYIIWTALITSLQYVAVRTFLQSLLSIHLGPFCYVYRSYINQNLISSKDFVICGLKTVLGIQLAGMFIYIKHCIFAHIINTEHYLVHIRALMTLFHIKIPLLHYTW